MNKSKISEQDNQIERIIPEETITEKIFLIRGQKVMIDRDLAELYDVETRILNQAVRRNRNRFPDDFMFQLTAKEYKNLRSQFVISSWGGSRYLPMVFTEQGVAMLSSVLNSNRAIMVNIKIIRVFTKLRGILESHRDILLRIEQLQGKDTEHDEKIILIFEILNRLQQYRQDEEDFRERRRIGHKPGGKKHE